MWDERLQFLFFSIPLAFIANFIAWKCGYFKSIQKKNLIPLSTKNVFFVFLIFFFIELFLIPVLTLGWLAWNKHFSLPIKNISLDSFAKGWLNLIAIYSCFFGIGGYFLLSKSSVQVSILRLQGCQSVKQAAKDFFFGSMTWLVAYPIVLVLSQLISLIVSHIYKGPRLEQVAVQHLKATISSPMLFWTTVIAIIFVVPLVEELLFRGYLLTWLQKFFRNGISIILSSGIFSFFHYSASQGIDNIELLVSLFILACFLGYIYERQQSLWAPIGLHTTFNAISISMILLT